VYLSIDEKTECGASECCITDLSIDTNNFKLFQSSYVILADIADTTVEKDGSTKCSTILDQC
jgi:hypothetical protein